MTSRREFATSLLAPLAFAHRERPLHGVQFHPESIASEHGHALLANFLRIARGDNRGGNQDVPRAA